MKVSSSLFVINPACAQVYYAIRTVDKKGTGWVDASVKELTSITGLAYSSLQRILNKLNSLGWLYSLNKKGGRISVAYKSVKKITSKVGVYVSLNKKMLRDRPAIMSRVTHAVALFHQQCAEAKLLYLINRGRLPKEAIYSSDSYRDAKAKANSGKDATGQPLCLFVEKGYTVGVNQSTLAKDLKVTRQTISNRLKNVEKIKVYKRTSLLDDSANVYLYVDEETNDCRAYKRMPYIYKPSNITSRQIKKIKLKAKAIRISRGQLYAAKLCAITAGFGYSESGAMRYIEKVGVTRFKRNTYRLKNVNSFSWEEESYLESPDGDE